MEKREIYGRMRKMWYYYVRDSKQEDSIERILKRELGLSRKQISRLKFQKNGLSVDGCQRRSTDWLRRGETLAVSLMDGQAGTLEEFREEPRVLYEDESLAVVEKCSGQVCHLAGCIMEILWRISWPGISKPQETLPFESLDGWIRTHQESWWLRNIR